MAQTPDKTAKLLELTSGRAHFSGVVPGLQIAWDSTSLGYLKECPRKYYYFMMESWRSKNEAIPLVFGIMYHSALETYDHAAAKGDTHEVAMEKAIRRALSDAGKYEESIDAEGNSQKVWKPWVSGDKMRTRQTLVRAIVWYLEQFGNKDNAKTIVLANGKAAVELSFRMETDIITPDGKPYLLCGHIDRMVMFNGDLFVLDRKTTVRQLNQDYFKSYNPDNQMSLYTLAANVVFDQPAKGVIIDAVQNQVGFSRFQRGFTLRSASQLDEWQDDFEMWMKRAEEFAEAQYWPMNDKACHNYNGCTFRDICSKDRSVRDVFLKADFERKEWNPLVPRNH